MKEGTRESSDAIWFARYWRRAFFGAKVMGTFLRLAPREKSKEGTSIGLLDMVFFFLVKRLFSLQTVWDCLKLQTAINRSSPAFLIVIFGVVHGQNRVADNWYHLKTESRKPSSLILKRSSSLLNDKSNEASALYYAKDGLSIQHIRCIVFEL